MGASKPTRCIVICEACGATQSRGLEPDLVCAKCGGKVEVYVPLALVLPLINHFVDDLRKLIAAL